MSQPPSDKPSLPRRVYRSAIREPYTGDRRSRLRIVMNNLVLQLHPAQVPVRTLRFTYTWGLGGLSALLGLFALPYLNFDMDSVGINFRSRRGRWLALFSAAAGVLLTIGYVVLDSNGLVPLALLLLGLIGYYEFNRRAFKATHCEAILGLFVLVLFGFITLTVIGVLFRGPGMALMWPWEVTAALY